MSRQLSAEAEAAYQDWRSRVEALGPLAEFDRPSPIAKAEWIRQYKQVKRLERRHPEEAQERLYPGPSCALKWNVRD